ncbi:MAG: hypothetical protein L0312_26700 [Acidobacteria bacterium]|nr:hypothetical protein [Acidobacteriota bacterium]
MNQADEVRAILTTMRHEIGQVRVAQVREVRLECRMRKLVSDLRILGVDAVYYADLEEVEVG